MDGQRGGVKYVDRDDVVMELIRSIKGDIMIRFEDLDRDIQSINTRCDRIEEKLNTIKRVDNYVGDVAKKVVLFVLIGVAGWFMANFGVVYDVLRTSPPQAVVAPAPTQTGQQ